jgi:hypothetical protein
VERLRRQEEAKLVTPSEAQVIGTSIEDAFTKDAALSTIDVEGVPTMAVEDLVDRLETAYPTVPRSYLEDRVGIYLQSRGGSVEGGTAGESLSKAEVDDAIANFNISSVVDNGNGTSTITYHDGTTETGTHDELRAMLVPN